MKNIFDFATKELSQDAFLMWLLENYEDEEIGEFAKYFLLKMINEKEDSKITNLKTRAQCKDLHNADVLIECKINDKDVAIVLEDKVYTRQHDSQLEKIEEEMKKMYKDRKKFYIFYKTGFVIKEEFRDINNNNKSWRIFNSYDINECFEKFYGNKVITNMLLSMYRDYIKDLVTMFNISDDDVIDESKKEWGMKSNKWVALFDQIESQGDNDKGVQFYTSYWYKYIFIKHDDNFFSVEIRSNTLKKGKYSLKLVMYSMNESKQTAENLKYFRSLCEKNNIPTSGGTKQVASITKENIHTVRDLKNAVKEVVSLCEGVYKGFDANKLNSK